MAPPPPRRVPPPAAPPPAVAWLETELEQKRLLDAPPSPVNVHRKQSGLTLSAWSSSNKYIKCPVPSEPCKVDVKTKFQKRKEKLISILKPPYFILTMIIIMVSVHVVGGARAALEWTGREAWWWQPWRVVTYSLLHASATHLAMNALVALAVGWRLEAEQGWWRVAAVWWAGAAAGALAAGALQPAMSVIGASASVYALLTAHLPNVGLRFGHIPLWWFRPLSVAVLGASEACWELGARAGRHEARVAWSAHALGAVVGLMAFLVFTGEHARRVPVLVCRCASGAALAAAATLCALHATRVLPHLDTN